MERQKDQTIRDSIRKEITMEIFQSKTREASESAVYTNKIAGCGLNHCRKAHRSMGQAKLQPVFICKNN